MLRRDERTALVIRATRELHPVPGSTADEHARSLARADWLVEQVTYRLRVTPGLAPTRAEACRACDAVTHYEVLGVDPDASDRTIRAAYRRRARETHPDTGGSSAEFAAVSVAWSHLGHARRRAAYDAGLDLADDEGWGEDVGFDAPVPARPPRPTPRDDVPDVPPPRPPRPAPSDDVPDVRRRVLRSRSTERRSTCRRPTRPISARTGPAARRPRPRPPVPDAPPVDAAGHVVRAGQPLHLAVPRAAAARGRAERAATPAPAPDVLGLEVDPAPDLRRPDRPGLAGRDPHLVSATADVGMLSFALWIGLGVMARATAPGGRRSCGASSSRSSGAASRSTRSPS